MEGYVQGALRKELRIAPFVERFLTQLLWESAIDNFYQYFERNS